MTAVVYAFGARKAVPRPWQNDELAELYRVVDLLGKAGLSVETDMGVSDEGDPWFIFCRADSGDVLVHFARIDGRYVAASAVADQSYQGANFREIIDQLIRQQPLVMPPPSAGARLFMHPAVVLTAFVATALLHSHQADAADNVGPAVPVTLNGNKAGDPGSALLKLFLVEHGRAIIVDKNALKEVVGSPASTPLASLMAIAIAAIAPLVDQSLEIASSGAGLDSHIAAAPSPTSTALSDIVSTNDVSAQPVATHEVSAVLSDGPADPVMADKAVASVPVAQVSLLALTNQPTHADASGTSFASAVAGPANLSDHLIIRPVIHQTAGVTDGTTTAATTTGTDVSHHIDISDLDSAAVEVLLSNGTGKSGSHTLPGDSSANWGSNGSSNTGTGAVIGNGGSTTSGGGSPTSGGGNTNDPGISVDGSNPTALLNALSDFTYSTPVQHAVSGPLQASSYLSLAVSAYSQISGGSVELIVFHDPDAAYSIFPFVKGVLFVEDTEISVNPSSLHGGNTDVIHFANGETMTLIGIIVVDANHPLPA